MSNMAKVVEEGNGFTLTMGAEIKRYKDIVSLKAVLVDDSVPGFEMGGKVHLTHPLNKDVAISTSALSDIDELQSEVYEQFKEDFEKKVKESSYEYYFSNGESNWQEEEFLREVVKLAQEGQALYLGLSEEGQCEYDSPMEYVVEYVSNKYGSDPDTNPDPRYSAALDAAEEMVYEVVTPEMIEEINALSELVGGESEIGEELIPELRSKVSDLLEEQDASTILDVIPRNAHLGMSFMLGGDSGEITFSDSGSSLDSVIVDENFTKALKFLRIDPSEFAAEAVRVLPDDEELHQQLEPYVNMSINYEGQPPVISVDDFIDVLENCNEDGHLVYYARMNVADMVKLDPREPVVVSGGQIGIVNQAPKDIAIRHSGDLVAIDSFVEFSPAPSELRVDNDMNNPIEKLFGVGGRNDELNIKQPTVQQGGSGLKVG